MNIGIKGNELCITNSITRKEQNNSFKGCLFVCLFEWEFQVVLHLKFSGNLNGLFLSATFNKVIHRL